ncbi:MAG: hypothetical protein ACOZCL_12345 [Bacillota bacterium]
MLDRKIVKKMVKYRNLFTLASIFIIVIMFYIAAGRTPDEDTVYPDSLFYNSYEYGFHEIINDSPLKYSSKPGVKYDGFVLLFQKKNLKEKQPESIYIYTTYRTYRKYVLKGK